MHHLLLCMILFIVNSDDNQVFIGGMVLPDYFQKVWFCSIIFRQYGLTWLFSGSMV